MGVDEEWALLELRRFVALTVLERPPDPPGVVDFSDTSRPVGRRDEIVASAHVVEQILDRVLPRWPDTVPEDVTGRWQGHREAAQRAITQVGREAEIREKLGDAAPRLDAGQLHSWVWDAARSLWQSNHYREAVRAAAVMINAATQNKLERRDISETALFQSAYSSDEPKPGQPRLRLPDDDNGRTSVSARRGVMALAEGCYAVLRNPASHDPLEELEETEALEQLAAFSVLARLIDRSKVVR